jgi:hypothetical protein
MKYFNSRLHNNSAIFNELVSTEVMRQDVLSHYMRINAKRNFYLHLEHFFSLNLNYAAYDTITSFFFRLTKVIV